MPEEVQDKREAIIKAAFRLFAERGFDGTPTSLISKEAGVATGTLFRYFATKEDLINSAYATAKSHMAASLKAGIDKEPTIEAKSRRLWGNSIRWGVNNPDEFRFLNQFASSPYITKITAQEAMSNFGFLEGLLEEGIRRGAIKDIQDMLLAEMLFDANGAIIKRLIQNGDTGDVDELIDASFDLLWSGIGNNRSRR